MMKEQENTQSPSFSNIWRTRPYRIPSSQGSRAWLSGVAEGIAVRYQIDVALVRIAFVALSFAGGIGIALYAAAVLVFPRYGTSRSAGQHLMQWSDDSGGHPSADAHKSLHHSERNLGLAAVIALAIFGLTGGFVLNFGGIVVLVAVAVAIWLLFRRTPNPPQVMANFSAPAGLQPEANPAGNSQPESQEFAATPPSWDPLGTAPFAWDLPDPEPVAKPAQSVPKKKSFFRRFVAAIFAMVMVLVTALAIIGAIFGIRWLTGDDTVVAANGSWSVSPTMADGEHPRTFTGTNGTVTIKKDFTAGNDGSQTIDLNFIGSNIDVNIPKTTAEDSYAVKVECGFSAGSTGCEDKTYKVIGDDKNEVNWASKKTPMVHVSITATASALTINQKD